jgi:phosphopantetheine--protein transferase-like protein
MSTPELLRETVADFCAVDPSEVGPEFPLWRSAVGGSLKQARLDVALRRRLGWRSDAVYTARTFGDLLNAFLGQPTAASTAPAPESNGALSAGAPELDGASRAVAAPQPGTGTLRFGCGVDLEQVSSLPETADCWEDPFYRAHFTAEEIAYCLAQVAPAEHFAARWCAKEALKKSDPSFLSELMIHLEVALEPSGAPYLRHESAGQWRRLPHALSLSHTAELAVAFVVNAPEPLEMPPPPPAAPTAVPVPAMAPERGRRVGVVSLVVAMTALVLAAIALWRTLPQQTGP